MPFSYGFVVSDGQPGQDGASAYSLAVSNGFLGTEQEWLASLVGPQGPSGTDGFFEFDKVEPDDVWIITHNLGFRPNITVFDLDGAVVHGDIIHINSNVVSIDFGTPVAGSAYLS
jgi:hypothetical protein